MKETKLIYVINTWQIYDEKVLICYSLDEYRWIKDGNSRGEQTASRSGACTVRRVLAAIRANILLKLSMDYFIFMLARKYQIEVDSILKYIVHLFILLLSNIILFPRNTIYFLTFKSLNHTLAYLRKLAFHFILKLKFAINFHNKQQRSFVRVSMEITSTLVSLVFIYQFHALMRLPSTFSRRTLIKRKTRTKRGSKKGRKQSRITFPVKTLLFLNVRSTAIFNKPQIQSSGE